VALTFPRDEELKPKPAPVIGPKGGVVGDPLDRLIEELARSKKTVAEKVDALFLAALGRFATATEQKRVKDKYGDKLTADALNKLLAEIAATPEYDAHIRSLQKRAPARTGPGVLPDGTPLFPGSDPFKLGGGQPGLQFLPQSFGSGIPPATTPKKP
jgi:hypothetical protein